MEFCVCCIWRLYYTADAWLEQNYRQKLKKKKNRNYFPLFPSCSSAFQAEHVRLLLSSALVHQSTFCIWRCSSGVDVFECLPVQWLIPGVRITRLSLSFQAEILGASQSLQPHPSLHPSLFHSCCTSSLFHSSQRSPCYFLLSLWAEISDKITCMNYMLLRQSWDSETPLHNLIFRSQVCENQTCLILPAVTEALTLNQPCLVEQQMTNLEHFKQVLRCEHDGFTLSKWKVDTLFLWWHF